MPQAQTAVNYTDDQVARMIDLYTSANSDEARKEAVETLANDLGKKTRSIIAKLSNLKVYVTPTRTTKTGAKIVSKKDIVNDIAQAVGVEDAETLSSLGKATKATLELLLSKIE